MRTLDVNVQRGYTISIGRDCLKSAGQILRGVSMAAKAVVVTDSNVGAIYAETVLSSLKAEGFEATLFTFPAGESSKNYETIYKMLCAFCGAGLTRRDAVVALGGGVTGDMAGFAASVYLRGIDFIQIPTSLLAQIDSSVGGKTGIDLPAGKNLCGSFWQPRAVLIDLDVLQTLPKKFFNDGMGEAIKYGCIKSKELFNRLLGEDVNLFLEDMVYECVDIKRQVVERDEKESGERMLLNFGHTLGHALEKYYNFNGLSHGEAVGIGMLLVTQASEKNGLTEKGTADKIKNILKKYSLPAFDEAPLESILKETASDKKNTTDALNFVLLSKIGESFIHPLKTAEIPSFFNCGEAVK